MTVEYKPFLHVVRIDHPDCEGLLENDGVEITAKIDGTNAVVWYDSDQNVVCGGSRKRQLSLDADNAGFFSWLQSNSSEAIALRDIVTANPSLIIYGEWMGDTKFIGTIKAYDPELKSHMVIFDVFDTENLRYYSWREIDELVMDYPAAQRWIVPILSVLDHPTKDDIINVAERNHAFLPDNIVGEGVVCKVPGWTDAYGHVQYGKFVLNRPSQHVGKKKQMKKAQEHVEEQIVIEYLTDSEITKCMAKIANICGTEEFHYSDVKQMGMLMTMTFADLLTENIMAIMKKFKTPTINFGLLKSLCQQRVRSFLGL